MSNSESAAAPVADAPYSPSTPAPTPTPEDPLQGVLHARQGTHRCADVLVDILVKSGVEVVFGLPGGAIAAMNDALMDRKEIRVITTRHESGAMFAAAAYARITQKPAVVMVTSGPFLVPTSQIGTAQRTSRGCEGKSGTHGSA